MTIEIDQNVPLSASAFGPRPAAEWTPDADAELRRLWDLGEKSARIGELLKRSKNSIVGRAHRLGLASRPSPIKSAWPGHAPLRVAAPASVRPRVKAPAPRPESRTKSGGVSSLNSPVPPAVNAVAVRPLDGIGVLFGTARRSQCAFPLWDDSAPQPQHVCGQPVTNQTATGVPSPYCAGHHARCHSRAVRRFVPGVAGGAPAEEAPRTYVGAALVLR